jgi:hypothetical protein
MFTEAWRKRKAKSAPQATEAAPVENAPPPDVSAENMKAKLAALDDGTGAAA